MADYEKYYKESWYELMISVMKTSQESPAFFAAKGRNYVLGITRIENKDYKLFAKILCKHIKNLQIYVWRIIMYKVFIKFLWKIDFDWYRLEVTECSIQESQQSSGCWKTMGHIIIFTWSKMIRPRSQPAVIFSSIPVNM